MKNANTIQQWIKMLSIPACAPSVHDGAQEALNASSGHHRRWIIACLRAIAAYRNGTSIDYAATLPDIDLPAPAATGAFCAQAVWSAYLQFVLNNPAAGDWLKIAILSLDPTALRAGINDNPEPWWANELLILHALQSYAFLTGGSDLQSRLDRCIDFHLAEIQPDHATNEPWTIHAFLQHPNGETSAGALLHAAMVQGGGELTPSARLIIADAVFCLTHRT